MAVSFATDILPLFRSKDVNCMKKGGVALDSYEYMSNASGDSAFPDHANARHVHAHLAGDETPRMPPDGAWPAANLEKFAQWMTDGFQP
jgi:hypothetical protein